MKTVSIETLDGRQDVPCRFTSATGLLAVTPDQGERSHDGKVSPTQRIKWAVTHTQTGLLLFRSRKTLGEVIDMVRELDDEAWQSAYKGQLVGELPEPLKQKVFKFMEKHGYRLSPSQQPVEACQPETAP